MGAESQFTVGSDEAERTAGTPECVTDTVLGILTEHDGRAFTASEIADSIDVAGGTVSTTLSHLADLSLVANKGMYWTVSGDYQRLYAHDDYAREPPAPTPS